MAETGLEASIPQADQYSQKIEQTARHIANYTNTLDDGQWAQVVREVELIRAERVDRRRGQKAAEEESLQEQAMERLILWLAQVFRDLLPEGRRELLAKGEEFLDPDTPPVDTRELSALFQELADELDEMEGLSLDRLVMMIASLDLLLEQIIETGVALEGTLEGAMVTYLEVLLDQLQSVMLALDAPMATSN